MTPVVGYAGGKRRLLPRLRPYFDPARIALYIEPFVGMGAMYLDLRSRGFRGAAALADSNATVADFWRAVHNPDGAAALIRACDALSSWPKTVEGFAEMKSASVDGVDRVARFLWLTNYTFGNQPPLYRDGRWVGFSSKFGSSAKWGKTFPWTSCVERLGRVVKALAGVVGVVRNDGLPLLRYSDDASIYADPPYAGVAPYVGDKPLDYITPILNARCRELVLSEKTDLRPLPPGWACEEGALVERWSQGRGARGSRAEFLYFKGAP